jgi:hypothetical protein
MEILRVSPYAEISVDFLVPAGITSSTITANVTDMADLSVSTLTFLNKSSGNIIDISLPGNYDSSYRVEIVKNLGAVGEVILQDETYEIVRPYVDPSTKASTASDIATYTANEEIARAIIDSIVTEGFYYKKKVLHFTGTGADYLPIWDDVKKVLAVYENNKLVEDREYEVSSDKTAIIEKSSDNINRAESSPLVLPAAASDSLDPQFIYRGFGKTWDYLITVEYGYTSVPSDIVRATEMLIHDLECGKLDYYKRFISSYNTDQYRIQFDKGLFEGTGNIIVDKILSKYTKSITKLGVL